MKRPFLTRAKDNLVCSQAGQVGPDTLSAVKDVYMAFRTERQLDKLCGGAVTCIVPGTTSESPANECLDAAWRSLQALENKGIGP